jgi:hypothetical protein
VCEAGGWLGLTGEALAVQDREGERDFIATGKLPLLQIETHGDKEGIGLSQTNGFDWPELMREFTQLNELTRLRPVVVLAACHGF